MIARGCSLVILLCTVGLVMHNRLGQKKLFNSIFFIKNDPWVLFTRMTLERDSQELPAESPTRIMDEFDPRIWPAGITNEFYPHDLAHSTRSRSLWLINCIIFQTFSIFVFTFYDFHENIEEKFLTHFWPILPLYTPWKYQKTKVIFLFSGGITWEHLLELG